MSSSADAQYVVILMVITSDLERMYAVFGHLSPAGSISFPIAYHSQRLPTFLVIARYTAAGALLHVITPHVYLLRYWPVIKNYLHLIKAETTLPQHMCEAILMSLYHQPASSTRSCHYP